MDATLPPDFHHAREPDPCQILGCPTGSAMARHIDHLTDRLSMERARADRLDAECAKLRHDIARHVAICAEQATEIACEERRVIALMDQIAEMGATTDRLRAEVEALRADAERYRWLRKHSWVEKDVADPCIHYGARFNQAAPAILDEEIDKCVK